MIAFITMDWLSFGAGVLTVPGIILLGLLSNAGYQWTKKGIGVINKKINPPSSD